MQAFKIGTVDGAVVLAYFAFILWRGFRYARRHENAEQYFLAGRSLAWPLVGLSLFASNISSSSLVGMAGAGYGTGFAVFSYEWMSAVALVALALVFLPLYLRTRVYTMPEFLERRYDRRARTYFSALTILTNIGIDTAATLYAGALVIQLVFPALPLWQPVLALALLSGLYTVAGGLRAVVFTDAIQAVLLLAGSVVLTVLAWRAVGGWEAVAAAAPPAHFRIFRPAGDAFLPWTGVPTGVLILGFYFWCTNQFIVQRALGARDLRHGQWGALLAGLLKVVTPLALMIVPGAMARVLYPDLPRPDLVYPTLLFDLLPAGVLGLVLAGLLAAMMSSIDSALNSASTLVTMDFYRRWRPEASGRRLMLSGRIFTAAFMVLSAVWAPQIARFPTLWEYLQAALSFVVPPMAALFLVGVFWRRANGAGAVAAIAAGVGAAGLLLVNEATGWLPRVHYLHVAGVLFALSAAVLVVVSLLTSPPDPRRVADCTWSRGGARPASGGGPWYRDPRHLSVALLALTAAVLVAVR